MATRRVAGDVRGLYLGGGDYDHPDRRKRARAAAHLFMDHMHAVEPKVLETLYAQVSPAYTALAEKFGNPVPLWLENWQLTQYGSPPTWDGRAPGAYYRIPKPLPSEWPAELPELREWAAGWNLDVTWVKTRGLYQLDRLRVWQSLSPATRANLRADPHENWVPVVTAEPELHDPTNVFRFESGRYRPENESRAEAAIRLQEAFDTALSAHLTERTRSVKSLGWEKKPQNHEMDHLTWLAAFQVKGRNYSQVAREYHVQRQTAKEAIVNMATLLDLPLRLSPAGRPKR